MTAWLFDVDGVITNPQTKEANLELLNEISQILKKNNPVAFVTGRSIDWIEQRLLPKLKEMVEVQGLSNLFISGEFGGVSICFVDGKMLEEVDVELAVPQELKEDLEQSVKEFSESMFFDKTKKTMVSIEMHDGYEDINKFKNDQSKLLEILRTIVSEHNFAESLEVHIDTIATNVKNKKSNKANSTRQVLKWLESKGIVNEFVCFGDSLSDIDMGKALKDSGHKVEFVFVGKKEDVEGVSVDFPLITTNEMYEKGTLEFLQNY